MKLVSSSNYMKIIHIKLFDSMLSLFIWYQNYEMAGVSHSLLWYIPLFYPVFPHYKLLISRFLSVNFIKTSRKQTTAKNADHTTNQKRCLTTLSTQYETSLRCFIAVSTSTVGLNSSALGRVAHGPGQLESEPSPACTGLDLGMWARPALVFAVKCFGPALTFVKAFLGPVYLIQSTALIFRAVDWIQALIVCLITNWQGLNKFQPYPWTLLCLGPSFYSDQLIKISRLYSKINYHAISRKN